MPTEEPESGAEATVERREYRPDPGSLAEARSFVSEAMAGWELDPGDLPLIVSELATNALRHAQTPFSVAIAVRGPVVRLEVADGSSTLPRLMSPSADALNGRGLRIVAEFARRWGAETIPGEGKVIWAEIGAQGRREFP
jgi:hypothetical protein